MTDLTREARTPVRLNARLTFAEAGTGGPRQVPVEIRNLGRTGTVCRVEEPGAVEALAAGDEVTLTVEPAGGGEPATFSARVARRLDDLPSEGSGSETGREARGETAARLELALTGSPGAGSSDALRERLAGLIRSLHPAILLVGFSGEDSEAFRRLLGRGLPTLTAESTEEALRLVEEREIAILCLGEGLAPHEALRFLETVYERHPQTSSINLVLAGGTDLLIFQDLISDDQVYYLTQQPVLDADLMAIVGSALDRWWGRRLGSQGPETEEKGVYRLQEIVEVARRVALQRSLDSAGDLTGKAIRELLDADRAYYLIYEPEREVLWSGDPGSRAFREESAAVGLVSFVARTGRALLLDRAGADPRYEREADDAAGTGRERFLAVPVRGSNRSVLAVLVAVRGEGRPPFSDAELVSLELLADQVASSFSQLALQSRLDNLLDRHERALKDSAYGIFREEAVGHHTASGEVHGQVLQLSPRWTRWTFWVLLSLLATAFVFSLVGTLSEWASGPAVVRMQGNRELTATAAGVVSSVEVEPGDAVAKDQLLVRFYGAQEVAELERIRQELELQLINRLRNPSDRGAASALIALRAQRQLAEARLEERTLRAPIVGRVSDVRVRRGQLVGPGEIVLSLRSEWVEPSIVALLPGHYRPLLEPGMRLRLEVQGYEYAYLDLTVDSVGAEVIGPNEARRLLGSAIADAVLITGGVVPVEARLPSPTFEAAGVTYDFHDGMYGTAEVAVRSDRILLSLFPSLKTLLENHGPPESSGSRGADDHG